MLPSLACTPRRVPTASSTDTSLDQRHHHRVGQATRATSTSTSISMTSPNPTRVKLTQCQIL